MKATFPSLQGKSVFISGGTTGIGADLVRAFVKQGCRVAFIGRNRQAADALMAELNASSTLLFFEGDVTDCQVLQTAIVTARDQHGPITVLLNNAANDQRHAWQQVTPVFWDQAVAVNLRHQFFAIQAVAPDMRAAGGGSIINLSSTSWKIKAAGYPIYATCKAAINGLTRSMARELGADRIRVNTLTPGWVMTPKQLQMWVDEAGIAELERNQCLPDRVQGTDVANLALFLAADESAMCTAQEFVVDGGWT